MQHYGTIHGGVIAPLADTAVTFAAASVLGDGVVTSDLDVDYLAPATGDSLIAVAKVVNTESDRGVCLCLCDVYASTRCARALSTVVKPGKDTQSD